MYKSQTERHDVTCLNGDRCVPERNIVFILRQYFKLILATILALGLYKTYRTKTGKLGQQSSNWGLSDGREKME